MDTKCQILNEVNVRRKGQTLVEFAITLPILLLLMFGIIEFGRIFQAWVSLQNSARAGARYASTGGFDRYYDESQLDTLVPCLEGDLRGGVDWRYPIKDDPYKVSSFDPNNNGAGNNTERLFATWFNGLDCDPNNDGDQILREDILRLMAIYAEAASGAGGLAIAPVDVESIDTETGAYQFLTSVWHPFYPQFSPDLVGGQGAEKVELDSDLNGYFSVMVCSTRDFLDSRSIVVYDGTDPVAGDGYAPRYITVTDPTDPGIPQPIREYYDDILAAGMTAMPGCFLNEQARDNPLVYTDIAPVRWLDAGEGGDRVTVAVTFFHPLITPLGLTTNIPIQARRSAIVEDFRVSAVAPAPPPVGGAIPSSGAGTGGGTIDDPNEDPTETSTLEPTVVPTSSPTPEAQEFLCSDVTLVDVDFDPGLAESDRKIGFEPGSVIFRVYNKNNTQAIFKTAELDWASADYIASGGSDDPIPLYPGLFFSKFTLDNEVMWQGTDTDPSTNMTTEGQAITSQSFYIPAQSSVTFSAIFNNGPVLLNEVLPRGAFTDTNFTIVNPLDNSECPNVLNFSSTTTELDDDFSYDLDNPDSCATGTIEFLPASNPFQSFGVVQLQVTNKRNAPAPLDDFSITWGPWEVRDETGSVKLRRVVIGGSSSLEGDEIWSAPDDNGVGITETSPGVYTSITRSSGTWIYPTDPYMIPAKTTRNVWFIFNGDNLSGERNMFISDLNGSQLNIGCATTNDVGIGGTVSGPVTINEAPTPPATIDPSNTAPTANDDAYALSSGQTMLSIPPAQGVIINDTDCKDDTVGRTIKGTPCTDDTNPANFTDNGDKPLKINTCGSGCSTDKGARIDFDNDGGFTYDISNSDALYCEATGTIVDTYTYQIRDNRGARSTATVTISVQASGPSNQRPDSKSVPTFTIDMATQSTIGGSSNKSNSNNLTNALFTDPDGDSLSLDNPPSFNNTKGSLSVNSDGSWTYNPFTSDYLNSLIRGDSEIYTITVTANDGKGKCSTKNNSFKIKILGAADPVSAPTATSSGTFGGGDACGGADSGC